jgi:hypothetical protein
MAISGRQEGAGRGQSRNARVDLARYKGSSSAICVQQQHATQATVAQLEALVRAAKAAIATPDDARLCDDRSPIDGRRIRPVDRQYSVPDQTGIVVITQPADLCRTCLSRAPAVQKAGRSARSGAGPDTATPIEIGAKRQR